MLCLLPYTLSGQVSVKDSLLHVIRSVERNSPTKADSSLVGLYVDLLQACSTTKDPYIDTIAERAFEVARQFDSDLLEGYTFYNVASRSIMKGDYSEAERSLRRSLAIIKNDKWSSEEYLNEALVYNSFGVLYAMQGIFDKAIQSFDLTVKYISKKCADRPFTICSYPALMAHQNLSHIYKLTKGSPEKCLFHTQELLALANKTKLENPKDSVRLDAIIASGLYNSALYKSELGTLENPFDFLYPLIQIDKKHNKGYDMIIHYYGFGKIFNSRKEYTIADSLLDISIQIINQYGGDDHQATTVYNPFVYLEAARSNFHLQQLKIAEQYIDQSIFLMEEEKEPQSVNLVEAYTLKKDIHMAAEDKEKSYEAYKKLFAYKEIVNRENMQVKGLDNIKLFTDSTSYDSIFYDLESEVLAKRIKQQKGLEIFLKIFLALLLTIGGILIARGYLKK